MKKTWRAALLCVAILFLAFSQTACVENIAQGISNAKEMLPSSNRTPGVHVFEIEMPKYRSMQVTQAHLDAYPVCAKRINKMWAEQGIRAKVVLVGQKSRFQKSKERFLGKLKQMAPALIAGGLTKSADATIIADKAGKRIRNSRNSAEQHAEQEMQICIQEEVARKSYVQWKRK